MCNLQVLSARNASVISRCMQCKAIVVWHRNIVLNFTLAELRSFRNLLAKLDFDECLVRFADGSELAVMATPNPGINFAFDAGEWHDMKEAVGEALYLGEVYDLME